MSETNKPGVKTEEGKAVSRYNAQKHSILRETVSEYETNNFVDVFDEIADDIKPNGRVQELIVEIIASNYIRLQRIAKAETEVIKEALSPEKMIFPDLVGREYVPIISASDVERLALYSRYQTATENRIFRAIMLLKNLKYEQS